MFADSTRVKILYALFESELCVCDIARVLDLTQSAVSHQLRILKGRKTGEVPARRQNRVLFPGRRSCALHHQPGHGSYFRMSFFPV